MFPTTVDLKGRNRRTETVTGQCEIHHQSAAATTANKTSGLGSEQTKNLTTSQEIHRKMSNFFPSNYRNAVQLLLVAVQREKKKSIAVS